MGRDNSIAESQRCEEAEQHHSHCAAPDQLRSKAAYGTPASPFQKRKFFLQDYQVFSAKEKLSKLSIV